jgi:GTPase SAR1 family protein
LSFHSIATESVATVLTIAGDVGGQKTLRPYWRNYFESTDAVVWVVDSSDRMRMRDCGEELRGLLQEEVSGLFGLRHTKLRLS